MNEQFVAAVQGLNLKPGQSYRFTIGEVGYALTALDVPTVNPDLRPMMEPWFELPDPPGEIARNVRPGLVEPPDPVAVPEVEGDAA
jgi:hypothetical protein